MVQNQRLVIKLDVETKNACLDILQPNHTRCVYTKKCINIKNTK